MPSSSRFKQFLVHASGRRKKMSFRTENIVIKSPKRRRGQIDHLSGIVPAGAVIWVGESSRSASAWIELDIGVLPASARRRPTRAVCGQCDTIGLLSPVCFLPSRRLPVLPSGDIFHQLVPAFIVFSLGAPARESIYFCWSRTGDRWASVWAIALCGRFVGFSDYSIDSRTSGVLHLLV